MHTCGMKIQECWDNYWQCVEGSCSQASKEQQEVMTCNSFGHNNDLSQRPQGDADGKREIISYSFKSAERCQQLREMQKRACECVPSGELDARMKTRVEDFLREHEPTALNKKGEMKDKKIWKSWKGKRPQMFYQMIMRHRRETVELRNKEGEVMPWDSLDKKDEKPADAEESSEGQIDNGKAAEL